MERNKIDKILPDIYRIPVQLKGNPLKELNSYLISGGGKTNNLLIDTGFRNPVSREEIKEAFKILGLSLDQTDILLTHLHADHTGNAFDLIVPGNKIYMSEKDIAYIVGKDGEDRNDAIHKNRAERLQKHGIDKALIEEMIACVPSRCMAANMNKRDFTPLKEKDEIQVGDYVLKAIYTPGHTPGHMCFEIKGTGAMILGDHILFDITPNITDWENCENSLKDYLLSLDKIAQYNVSIPLPGHRKTGDFLKRIEYLKCHHIKRLIECRIIIEKLGKAYLYDIAGGMKWKIRSSGWEDFPAAQRWFALGECMAHIDFLKNASLIKEHETDGVIWYEAI